VLYHILLVEMKENEYSQRKIIGDQCKSWL